MSNTISLPEAFRQSAEEILARLLDNTQGAYGVVLATIDGHALLHAARTDLPADRIAAMTSSLVSLGETIAHEANQQKCRFVIVENSDGYVVTLRISSRMTLSTFAGKDTNLGMLLSATRSASEALGKAARQPSETAQ